MCIFLRFYALNLRPIAVADPGFPVGGAWGLVGGAWTPEAATFRKIFVITKELGPLGGARAGCAPPKSANVLMCKCIPIPVHHTQNTLSIHVQNCLVVF